MKGTTVFKIIGWVIIGIAAAAALGLALGVVVMWLWNWLMPELFGLPEIGYWKAVGIFILCHLLFKSHLHGHRKEDDKEKHAARFRKKVHSMIGMDEEKPAPGAGGESAA
jgi:hypothetical protein